MATKIQEMGINFQLKAIRCNMTVIPVGDSINPSVANRLPKIILSQEKIA